jgi:TetR/AcrR family transcriptional regulator, transcriptional repressor of aconitase
VPKISEERRTERREQILAGARRAFAEHGYEGATVARLEHEVGLSRGAIFNYFPSKEDLFVELAMQDTSRLSDAWLDEGLEGAVHVILETDPAWLGVYLELIRRVRTDPEFKRRIEERQQEVIPVNRARAREAQQSGELRDDIDVKQLGSFINLVLNGLALQLAQGEDPPSAELVVGLLNDAIGGPARSGTRPRTRL